jgi:hypothetical protein
MAMMEGWLLIYTLRPVEMLTEMGELFSVV